MLNDFAHARVERGWKTAVDLHSEFRVQVLAENLAVGFVCGVDAAEDFREEPASRDGVVGLCELASIVVRAAGDAEGEAVEVAEVVDRWLEALFEP